MAALSAVTSLVVESLTYPGISGYGFVAMMAGLAFFMEIDRVGLRGVVVWGAVPVLWGAFIFTESGSLLLAAVGTATLWLLPGLGIVFVALGLVAGSVTAYYRFIDPAE